MVLASMRSSIVSLVCALALIACGARSGLDVDTPEQSDAGLSDAGRDGGHDAGRDPDAGRDRDAGRDGGHDAGGHDAGPDDGGHDGGHDAGPPDAGRDAGPLDAGPPVCVREDFESGTDGWLLESLWTHHLDTTAAQGMVLRGRWSRCNEEVSAARMTRDVNLAAMARPELRFVQYGRISFNDTIAVQVSTDGGATWTTASSVPEPTFTWTEEVIDLAPWADRSHVRFAFWFHNVCGDPHGVEWQIDDVSICGAP